MAKGLSLHIGLNAVDPNGYDGWSGVLVACENDANDMAGIASAQGFTPQVLLTTAATAPAVTQAIEDAAKTLDAGDTFLLTYSGHGGQVPDMNGDEIDGVDETWCLYDRELIDDELYGLWSSFRKGTRIFVLSDSCHSGSVARAVVLSRARVALRRGRTLDYEKVRVKALPDHHQRRAYFAQQALYEAAQQTFPAGDRVSLGASVILISGCQDNQLSADGDVNGLFTETLLQVWNMGAFQGTYRDFHKSIVLQMPFSQTPNYFTVGASNPQFEASVPFSL